jgi:predicted nuclease of predicted toxin-antitoxin system
MRIKLDENIGNRGVELLRLAGHDVMTVRDQGLQGARDETLFDICAGEGRILVTLDHDFGQDLRFPPECSAGLVIVEPESRVTQRSLLDRLR